MFYDLMINDCHRFIIFFVNFNIFNKKHFNLFAI